MAIAAPAVLQQINTFPLKSGAPLRHVTVSVERRGLRGDRRWMVVDARGEFVTGRDFPRLVLVRANPTPGGVQLQAPGMAPLTVEAPGAHSERQAVEVWGQTSPAQVAEGAATDWLSEYLGTDCRLMYQSDDDIRDISAMAGGAAGDHVSFADGYPLLLIGTASLADLNRRLQRPVSMDNFRTNLVVRTDRPFVEDQWRGVRIGDCEFEVAKRCSRCVFTTVDPRTGQRSDSAEPLTTLRDYRLSRKDRGVMFGVNLIPRRLGELHTSLPVVPREQAASG